MGSGGAQALLRPPLGGARAASLSVAPQAGPKISPLRAPLGHRERSRGKATPPSGGSKRPPSPGGPPPPHASQGTAARRRALLSGRAKQHGGVCFHRARALAARGHNSTAACASAWRHVNSQSTAARRRALPQSGHGATSTARAQQHGGARFCRCGHDSQGTAARRRAFLSGPRQPEKNSTAGFAFTERPAWAPGHPRSPCGPGWLGFFAVVCASRAQRCDSWPLLGLSGRPARRVARSPTRARAQQHAGGLFCRAHFFLMEAGFVNFELLFIG